MRVRRGLRVGAVVVAAGIVVGAGAVGGVRAVPAAASSEVPQAPAPDTRTETEIASDEATASGSRVEVVGDRAETRQVFAEADGSFTMELSDKPVRVRQGDSWVGPNTTLKVQPDGSIGPTAAVVDLVFSGGGSGTPVIRLTDRDRKIELTWPDVLPAPTLSGDTATYANVYPDVDLRVRAAVHGFTQAFVVRTRQAAQDPRLARIKFGLATTGLTLGTDAQGVVSAKDSTGTVVFASSMVRMWDSPAPVPAPPPGEIVETPVTGAHHAVGTVELSPETLTVIPDQALLTNPDALFPIFIDPDFYPPFGGWTKVFSGYPGNAYWYGNGDDGLAKVGYCGWAGCNGIGVTRSFFQFDISALRGAQIFSGEFNMHEVRAPSCSPRPFQVWQVGPIDGGTTWYNQPGGWWGPLGTPNVAYGYDGCGPNYVGVPAGQSVINRLNDGSNVATFMMKAENEGDRYAWKKFDSGSLIVHYNWPPRVPSPVWSTAGTGPSLGCANDPANAFVSTARPTLRANLSDPDGEGLEANFEWWIWNGAFIGSTRTAFLPNGSPHAATIPAGAFVHGSRIAWRVRGGDNHIWGPWSAWCGLTVDTVRPGRPGVTSTDYPQDASAGYVGRTGAFTISTPDTDVLGYQWSLNFQDLPVVDVNSPFFVRATNGTAVIRATPTRTGHNDLYVRAVDRALNVSEKYQKPDGQGGFVPGGFGFSVGSAVPGPVGHWQLDGTGTAAAAPDASGRNHPGTVSGIWPGTSAAWTTGRVDDAVRFTGANTGYVGTTGGSTVDTSGTFSVSARVRLDTVDGVNHVAVSQDGSQVFGFFLGYVGDQRRFTFRMVPQDSTTVTTVRASAAAAPAAGVWTHLTGVYEVGSKQMRLYVNGALGGTATLNTPWRSTGSVQIGRAKYGSYTDFWPGAIDEVAVWDRMLADSEIQSLANTPTIEEAFYPLDEGAGTATADVSGNYRAATLSGGPSWQPGLVGTAAVGFDGVDDAITATRQAVRTDGSFTVTARARLDATNGNFQTVVSQDGPNSSGFALQYLPTTATTGRWAMVVSPADAVNPVWLSAQSTSAASGQWVNLAGVYDAAAGQIRLYVEGVEFVAGARVAAPVAGNVVIGRAKQRGTPLAYLAGRVDDVHIYTGVRTKDQIVADNLNPVTERPTAYSGQLARYVDHNGRHIVTSGPVPPGQHFEGSLGLPAAPGTANTRMAYSCQYPGGWYVSLMPNCENDAYTRLGEIGLLYISPPTDGTPTLAVYRCLVVATGDHFVSHDVGCESHRNEGRLGYVRGYRKLIRYVSERDHWTTVTGATAGYRPEGVQGLVAMTAEPNPRGLNSCIDGSDEFLSNDATCEGKTVRWWIGNTWDPPPPYAADSQLLFGCRYAVTGDRFTSLDEFCEGEILVGSLGYVITRL